jgi:uncharacterized protein (DUF433 family)
MTASSSTQRSFRLPQETLDQLDEMAARLGTTRNALVERLLREGLRLEDHPLIYFRQGGDGRRRACILGTRIYVYQLVHSAAGEDVDQIAEAFALSPAQVRAALRYYGEFRDEIDEESGEAARYAERERTRWERAQGVA